MLMTPASTHGCSAGAGAVRRPMLLAVDDDEEEKLHGLPTPHTRSHKKRRRIFSSARFPSTAGRHHPPQHPQIPHPFDLLPDDIVISILGCLSSQAYSPADLFAAALTCKRFRDLSMQERVLAVASRQATAVRAWAWCLAAHTFLKRCVESRNADAAFALGMIELYCLGNETEGVRLLAMAATARHADALFALAVLRFNGSNNNSSRRNSQAGVALCARAVMAGSMEAMRELGHCLKEGRGVARDERAAKLLLMEVNRREAMLFVNVKAAARGDGRLKAAAGSGGMARNVIWNHLLASDCGCPLPLDWLLQRRHPVHRFLLEWRALQCRPLPMNIRLRHCCNALCGRSETRPFEFRQCAACSSAFYCSHSCQSMDWKLRHLLLCEQPSIPSLIIS